MTRRKSGPMVRKRNPIKYHLLSGRQTVLLQRMNIAWSEERKCIHVGQMLLVPGKAVKFSI
jgi:hypothetical protein